jgi:hypothetical protein
MRVKTCAQKNKMGKNVTANSATSWVPSVFKQKDLEKAQANGLISADDQVTFPSTERIPKPPSGFRVMVFDFFLRGLSLPALCESFLGSNPTSFSGKSSFGFAPTLFYQRSLNWAELLSLFVLNRGT